jgi:hypothetical protein
MIYLQYISLVSQKYIKSIINISLVWGLKTRMLHLPPPTNYIFLGAHNQTIYTSTYTNLTSRYMIILQLNDSHKDSNQEFPFPLNPHINWIGNFIVVAPGTLATKMEPSFTCVQMYIQFSSKFSNICRYDSHMASSCSHVESSRL